MDDLRLLQIIRSVGFEAYTQMDTPGYRLLDRVITHVIGAAKYGEAGPRLENGMFLSQV